MDKNEWICEEEYKPSYHVLKKQLKHNKSLHPSYKQGLKEGLEAGYNQGFADATKKNKDEVCEWQWNEDSRNNEIFVLVKCKGLSYGDRIIFNSIRLFTYCPYCSKKILPKFRYM